MIYKDIRIKSGTQEITLGDQIDYLNTQTYTNVYWGVDGMKTRSVSITLDVEKAKDLITVLTEYLAAKEGTQ